MCIYIFPLELLSFGSKQRLEIETDWGKFHFSYGNLWLVKFSFSQKKIFPNHISDQQLLSKIYKEII